MRRELCLKADRKWDEVCANQMMKKLLLLILLMVGVAVAQAQPDSTKVGNNFSIPFYHDTPEGKILEARCTAATADRVAGGDLLAKTFEMKNFRNGVEADVQFIAQAPECQINPNKQTAFSPGHIDIFTPTTNLYIKGEGFYFEQAKRLLVISNNIETDIVKGLLKATALAPSKPSGTNQVLKIFSEHFQLDYETRIVHYTVNVHVVDQQTDITCDHLSAQLNTNGVIDWILAEKNVVINMTGRGQTTSERAYDTVTNGSEVIELTGQPYWHDGEQEAKADKFTYDKSKNFLTGVGHVQTKFPNHGTNAASGFSEMFADFATMQMPPDHGPVQSMLAEGNVVITNHADQSVAMGQKAQYAHDTDTFELTGDPSWSDKQMEVHGQLLSMVQSKKAYSAHGGAKLKIKLAGKEKGSRGFISTSTNQWLYVTSHLLDYRNGLAAFDNEVEAKLYEGETLQGTLRCELLTVRFAASNQIEKIVAHQAVHVSKTPDALWAEKTLVCDMLTVERNPVTGILRTAVAQGNVVGVQTPAGHGPAHVIIAADQATMVFAEMTNQVQSIVAEGDVSGEKVEASGKTNLFTGKLATYHLQPNVLLEITGDAFAKTISPAPNSANLNHPSKRVGEWAIYGARVITWDPKSHEFGAKGKFTVIPNDSKLGSPATLKP